jgi:hypothetical protein
MTVYEVTAIDSHANMHTNRFVKKPEALQAARDVIRAQPTLYVVVQQIIYTEIFEHDGRPRRRARRHGGTGIE